MSKTFLRVRQKIDISRSIEIHDIEKRIFKINDSKLTFPTYKEVWHVYVMLCICQC